MGTLLKLISELVLLVGFIVLYALILALPTMLLWNWVMPGIFGLKTIGFFQALGLNLLCGVLVRSRPSSD
jgi:hypothetical protein